MRRVILLAALAFTCLAWGSSADAGLVERDLFEPGDGLLTYDEATGREWLEPSAASAGEDDLDAFLVELATNDHYAGFRFATLADVESLALSAEAPWSIGSHSLGRSVETAAAHKLRQLFTRNLAFRGSIFGDDHFAWGLVATETGEVIGSHRFDGTSVYLNVTPEVEASGALVRSSSALPRTPFFLVAEAYWTTYDTSASGRRFAFWMYRDATRVPEPATAWLALTFYAAGSKRRRPIR